MNKLKPIIIAAVILGVIIAVLLYNKSRMAAQSRSEILTSIPVSVSTVAKEKIQGSRSFIGTIAGQNDVAIIAETEGRVTSVAAEVGQFVPAGATLVRVDDELKKAAFASAEVNYEKAKNDLERFELLHKESAATNQQFEGARLGAKAAEAQYIMARRTFEDTKISSPISGVVTSRPVNIGAYVQRGQAVANVVDISRLKVKLNVAESDVFLLKTGETVDVTTDVYPGVTFKGTIATISAKGDEAHTYPVEVRLANSKEHPLKAGMFARVAFTEREHFNCPVIPRNALVGSIRTPQVFVIENNMARLRNLVIHGELGSKLAIREGIREGETIVVNGQNNLKDSAHVTVVQ